MNQPPESEVCSICHGNFSDLCQAICFHCFCGFLGIIGMLDYLLIALICFLHVAALYRSVLYFRHGGSGS